MPCARSAKPRARVAWGGQPRLAHRRRRRGTDGREPLCGQPGRQKKAQISRMKLPDLSNSMYVARLRHIQSIREPEKHRNPDTQVRYFLPLLQRWKAAWLGREALAELRAQPFYYYLIARTRYYDQVMLDAAAGGVKRMPMIGCGSDTRAYRFEPMFRQQGVRILECDQPQAIHVKERLAKRWRADYVEYQPIDLHQEESPGLARWLAAGAGAKTLVVMEGVSPYVNDQDFCRFLRWLAGKLPSGSAFA